jgi:serine/threonine-protein kinase
MSLAPGSRLGSYEVIAAIGAGGMGEVYRARDTKLNRDVALKILPDAFALDPDRLARFTREAHVLAALNHPNIAAIYGLEESNGVRALVLELVDGPTLADRIAEGAIPLDQALPIARQITAALEAAHDQGIVHRDLKPANIKLRPDGTVKVLDFGLAKALAPAVAQGAAVTLSPTITTPAMTGVGVILGTAAYMSPEQAKGREADKRSDIWAFGSVLYEMLTGKRAFEGDDVSDTLANVLKTQPDWNQLPSATPLAVRRLLRRCLEKDRTRRLHDIADARLDIDETVANPSEVPTAVGDAVTQPVGRFTRLLPWVTTAALTVALAFTLWAPWRASLPIQPVRVETTLGADVSLTGLDTGAAIALSPDGRTFAFTGQASVATASQLYVRRLDQLQANALPGTEGAFGPFFSPDGQWLAFFSNGKLKKVSSGGGAVVTLCDAPNGRGGSWAEDGTITFRPVNTNIDGGMLLRVSSAGGTPQQVTSLGEGEANHRFPQVLPGDKGVLFYSVPAPGDFSNARIAIQPLPTGARKGLVQRGYYGRYLPSGHIAFIRDGTLFAAPFDIDRFELTGSPTPILEGIAASAATGVAQFAFSSNGTLAYVPGQAVGSAPDPIVWLNRNGNTSPLRTQSTSWSNPAFAPDGRRLAFDIDDGKQTDVWVYEWERNTLSRLTFDPGTDWMPVWTPDGQRIVFASNRGDKTTFNLYWQRADGAGEIRRLLESTHDQIPGSWHPTGRFLAFVDSAARATGRPFSIMILPMEEDQASGWKPGKPTEFVTAPSPAGAFQPAFSPDGRWIAYASNESGQNEVYVRPFPGPGGKWQISTDGGRNPVWSRTRHELFYVQEGTSVLTSSTGSPASRSESRVIMAAAYEADADSFRAQRPQQVSSTALAPLRVANTLRYVDLHPDGQRFAIAPARLASTVKQDKVVFIFNFFDELRRIAPSR